MDYPQAAYSSVTDLPNCPFTFEANTLSSIEHKANSCDVNINYPAMKATIYLTYKNVDGNIRKLLTDAQNFTYKHTVKADNIAATTFCERYDQSIWYVLSSVWQCGFTITVLRYR